MKNRSKIRRIALRNISGRNAGKDRAGTQGWRRPRQDAMPGETSGDARPASRGSFCWFNVIFSSDQRALVLKRTTDFQEPVTFGGQSLLRKGQSADAGQFRLRRAKEPLKAGRWVEHGPAGKDQRAACRGERLFALLMN